MPGNKWSALVWSACVPDGFTSKATSIRLLRSPKINKPLWSRVYTVQVPVINLDLFHIDSFIIMILFKRGALWRTHEPWHLKFVRNITDYWLSLAGLEGTEGFTDIRWETPVQIAGCSPALHQMDWEELGWTGLGRATWRTYWKGWQFVDVAGHDGLRRCRPCP